MLPPSQDHNVLYLSFGLVARPSVGLLAPLFACVLRPLMNTPPPPRFLFRYGRDRLAKTSDVSLASDIKKTAAFAVQIYLAYMLMVSRRFSAVFFSLSIFVEPSTLTAVVPGVGLPRTAAV